jgi:ABC-2 type transport system ATP-binding protein
MKVNNPDIEGIKKFDFVKKVEHQNGLVSLTVNDANKNLPLILQSIGKVESVEIHSPTLNDVFLHYTGREIREESGEGGWADRAINYQKKS